MIHDVNEAAQTGTSGLPGVPASRQQLRMWPNTERIATLGGFIVGGHSGIGSIRHGILADPRQPAPAAHRDAVRKPARPRSGRGADIHNAQQAYGSNGIIVELEVALSPLVDWQHTIALFDPYDQVLRCGLALVTDLHLAVCQRHQGVGVDPLLRQLFPN